MKKYISLILLGALLASAMSCGDSAPTDESTQTTDAASGDGDVTDETTTEELYSDNLGEYDFGGEEFTIYTRTTPLFYPYLNVSEETGEVLNDAVYARNRKLEERFNFTFVEEYYDYLVEGNDAPRQYLMAGDDTYDLQQGRNVHMFNYASEGFFYKIDELPMIDPSQPYWNQQLYSDLSMCGEHFFAIGAFNISAYDFTHVLLFNKDMISDLGLENPYDLVLSGDWTYDKFAELARAAVNDLNGDQVMDSEDQYGYTSLAKQVLPGFWIGAGATSIQKDSDGKLVYTAPTDEHFISVYQRIFEITWDDNVWYRIGADVDTGSSGEDEALRVFNDGHALFTNSSCFQLTLTRETEVDFGIIPYPKYDENQDKYYSRIEGCELFGVPRTNSNPEMASVILEAMACDSQNYVIPAYYDVMLKVKLTRDEVSASVLDLIFENRVFDYGDTILCTELRDGVLRTAFAEDNRNAASLLTSVESTVNNKLKTLNDSFEALAD